ncbi:MAG TPA: hypothetical protein VM598_01045 [Bdellovibrionota bacterium]|nr:hypothetical protein [Bdellovibrionota bacterium]
MLRFRALVLPALLGLLAPQAGWATRGPRIPGQRSVLIWEMLADGGGVEALQRSELTERGGLFANESQRARVAPKSKILCESALTTISKFSLELQLKRGGISNEQFDLYSRLGERLKPMQTKFFDLTVWATEADAQAKARGELPPSLVVERETDEKGIPWLRVRQATLWSVSGQEPSPVSRGGTFGVKRLDLPGELERNANLVIPDEFKQEGMLYWEWGRAGQVGANQLLPLIQLVAASNYLEMRALRGSLERSWVFIHSANEQTTRDYETYHPFRKLRPDCSPSGCWMVAPLSAFVNEGKYRAGLALPKVAGLREITQGALYDARALDFLTELQGLMSPVLDIRMPGQDEPLRWPMMGFDRSSFFITRASELFRRLGIERYRDSIVDVLRRTYNLHERIFDWEHHIGPLPETMRIPRDSLQFSGFDPELARRDPLHAEKLVSAVWHWVMRETRSIVTPPMGVPDSDALFLGAMERQGMSFDFYTDDPDVARQLLALGAKADQVEHVSRISFGQSRGQVLGFNPDPDRSFHQSVAGTPARVTLYRMSAAELARVSSRHPEMRYAARPGIWQALTLLRRGVAI